MLSSLIASMIVLVCWSIIFYVYCGYLLILATLSKLSSTKTSYIHSSETQNPTNVTVLLTVHNEAEKIDYRLKNLLDQNFPQNNLEILVASDGSTDGTDIKVSAFSQEKTPIRLLSFDRVGKSEAQNKAIVKATGDIIVFTDVDTRFHQNFLKEIVKPFLNPTIGCVTAKLLWEEGQSTIEFNQGLYWYYEDRIRIIESRLGILAVASGQAMAIRRNNFKKLPAEVGEDCIIPLDMALQGQQTVHKPEAVAYDQGESDYRAEFWSRVRMTARNWRGTWLRSALLNPFRYPGYAFSLWSHKILRWLTPFFLIIPFVVSLPALAHPVPQAIILLYLLGGVGVGLGWLQERGLLRVKGPWGTLFSFTVANFGFLLGVWKAIRGKRIVTYRSGASAD